MIEYTTGSPVMDLPYDIKERIASHLTGRELAVMCRVDRDFRPFFMKKVGPVFMNEIKNISRIFKNLQNSWSAAYGGRLASTF